MKDKHNKIFEDNELQKESVIKNFLTTASDGKNYNAISDFDRQMTELEQINDDNNKG